MNWPSFWLGFSSGATVVLAMFAAWWFNQKIGEFLDTIFMEGAE